MSGPPASLSALVRQWMEKAGNDLLTAEHILLITAGCPYEAVCFHAQQCVEKCLKAVLTRLQIPFRKTHDLEELSRSLPPELQRLASVAELAALTPHATVTRYPGVWPALSRDEAESAVKVARRVRDSVVTWLAQRP